MAEYVDFTLLPDEDRMADIVTDMAKRDVSFGAFLDTQARFVDKIDDITSSAFATIHHLNASVERLLELRGELDPQKKMPESKLWPQALQILEREAAQDELPNSIQSLCRIALIGALVKPETPSANLSAGNILDFKKPLRKRQKETPYEKVYRCAALALRNRANVPYSDPQMATMDKTLSEAGKDREALIRLGVRTPETSQLTAAFLEEKYLRSSASLLLKKLVSPSVHSNDVLDEVRVAKYMHDELFPKYGSTPEALAQQISSGSIVPQEYVDWELVPRATAEELGVELPKGGGESQGEPKRDRSDQEIPIFEELGEERSRLLLDIGLAWSHYWNDEDGVRVARRRLPATEAKSARQARYAVLVLPAVLSDGTRVEHGVGMGAYGNATLTFDGSDGLSMTAPELNRDGVSQAWKYVFAQNKLIIAALGGVRMVHSPNLAMRVLSHLLRNSTPYEPGA